jgi:hypothetical protein
LLLLHSRDSDRTVEHTTLYAAACIEVAHEAKVPVVDLHTAMGSGDQVRTSTALQELEDIRSVQL